MKKVLLVGLILKLACLFLFRNANNYDLQSYLQVGELTLNKVNIYPDIANLHHPYLPFFLYLEAFAFYLKKFSVNPIIVIKTINIIFDLGNLYLIYLLSKKNIKTMFLYAINPVTILISTFHGQFDAIPIFFLLFSLQLIEVRNEAFSMLIFSLAVMTKTWPILFIISFWKNLKKKKLILLVIIFPVMSIIIYSILFKTSIVNIIKTIISYQGLWGIWGVWTFFGKWRIRWQKLSTLIFLVFFILLSYLKKKVNIVKEMLYLLLFFFIFSPNFSIQYFAWIIPFLIIVKPKRYILLISFVTMTLISYYATPNLKIFQNIIQFITWVLFVYTYKVNEPKAAKDWR